MTFFPAVVLGAFFGGFWPGLLATLLSVLAANYFFTDQLRSLHVTNANDLTAAILFVLVGVIISGLSESLHRAQRRALEQQRERAEAQMELVRVNRITTIAQLTASIVHEVVQPISGVIATGHAALRWLDHDTPDVTAARQSIERLMKDANRAADVIGRIRELIKNAPPRKESFAINEAIDEVIALTRGEALKKGVLVEPRLAEGLPLIQGDRIQLQQVIVNLMINSIEAMTDVCEGPRNLVVGTGKDGASGVLVTVQDSGPGLKPGSFERLFDAFYTTKSDGTGMGLSICRSIIEAHGGRIWAAADAPRGAIFRFTLPAAPDVAG